MEAFGLPTSFGRAGQANKNSEQSKPRQQNNHRGGRGKGTQGARTSPYPALSGHSAEDGAQSERPQGPPRGRGRGRGGNNRGRGGARGGDDPRGPPPGQRSGFSKEQTATGTAFYSESFFENPWAALESKA